MAIADWRSIGGCENETGFGFLRGYPKTKPGFIFAIGD
jgi:hypothetical protein